MITFSPRFRSQSPAANGGPGGMLSYGDASVLRGLAGNDPRNTLLMSANDTNIDSALKSLLQGGSRTPINRAWLEAHYLNGQDLESILATREGIRKGTAQAFFTPDGKLNVRQQGQPGWNTAAPEGAIGIGADGGGFNPLTSAQVPGTPGAGMGGERFTQDVIRDPITGIGVSRFQQAGIQQRYGGAPRPKMGRPGSAAMGARPAVSARPNMNPSYAPFRPPQAGRGGRTT